MTDEFETSLREKVRLALVARERGLKMPSFDAERARAAKTAPARPRHRPSWALTGALASGLALVLVVAVLVREPAPQTRDPLIAQLVNSTRWHAPTDGLLDVHDERYYRKLPLIYFPAENPE